MNERPAFVAQYNQARGRAAHGELCCAHCQRRLANNLASGVAYGAGATVAVLCKDDWERLRWSDHRALEAAEATSPAALAAAFAATLARLVALDCGRAA